MCTQSGQSNNLGWNNCSALLQWEMKKNKLEKNVTLVAQFKTRNASKHINSAKGGKCVGMKMCCRHLLQSGSGKQQLLFPLLDCLSHKLLNIGPMESFPAESINLFVFLGGGGSAISWKMSAYMCFDVKIYPNNSVGSCRCCALRITWKNNDERHRPLMRHLELHIKRQPGAFLRSLGN